jgi:hypothetical protein
MKNKIEDLRDHLFETIELLKDEHDPMDLERAKVICAVAQTLIHSAKVEVDFCRETGAVYGSGFIPSEPRLINTKKLGHQS